jgi:hypothetical protein
MLTGTQFTCFTSTKVQILTPEELGRRAPFLDAQPSPGRAHVSIRSVFVENTSAYVSIRQQDASIRQHSDAQPPPGRAYVSIRQYE